MLKNGRPNIFGGGGDDDFNEKEEKDDLGVLGFGIEGEEGIGEEIENDMAILDKVDE